ncbi:MAG: hypothetical protein NQU46_06085 [Methanolinea sp.]|nr:hypothetical protein [Methanolinea sp.]
MHEILLFGVVIGAIFSIFASAILIHLGTLIDRFPLEDEGERERTLWSPREFTRFAVIVY